MKAIKQLSLISFALSFIFTSCSIDKRVYLSGYHIERQTGRFNTKKTEAVKTEQIKQNKSFAVEQSGIYRNTIDTLSLITIEKMLVSAEHDKRTLYTPPKINFLLKSGSIAINKEISTNSLKKAPPEDSYRRYKKLSILFAVLAILTFWSLIGLLLFGIPALIFAIKAKKIKKEESGTKENDRKFYWASIAALISLFVLLISLIISIGFIESPIVIITLLLCLIAFLSVIGFSTTAFPETKGKDAKYRGFAMALISLIVSILTLLSLFLLIPFLF